MSSHAITRPQWVRGLGFLTIGAANRLHFIAENSSMEWRRFISVVSFWIPHGKAFVISLGIVVYSHYVHPYRLLKSYVEVPTELKIPLPEPYNYQLSCFPANKKTSVTERMCVAITAHISMHWSKEGVLERGKQQTVIVRLRRSVKDSATVGFHEDLRAEGWLVNQESERIQALVAQDTSVKECLFLNSWQYFLMAPTSCMSEENGFRHMQLQTYSCSSWTVLKWRPSCPWSNHWNHVLATH